MTSIHLISHQLDSVEIQITTFHTGNLCSPDSATSPRLFVFFPATATSFQLYHGGDMVYQMRRRKPEPTITSQVRGDHCVHNAYACGYKCVCITSCLHVLYKAKIPLVRNVNANANDECKCATQRKPHRISIGVHPFV